MAHIKRLTAPRSWQIKKKEATFVTTPMPGPHKKNEAMTLNMVLKDVLKMTKTTRETKRVLHEGKIVVDGIVRRDHRFPVGVMDIISIPSLNESYKVGYSTKGKFMLSKLSSDPKEKLCKIVGKRILPKKRIQINLYDGRNVLVDKDPYKVGDSIIIAEGKIRKHLKLEEGAWIYLTGGKHISVIGRLTSVKKYNGMENDRIIVETKEGSIETLKEYAFVVDKETI